MTYRRCTTEEVAAVRRMPDSSAPEVERETGIPAERVRYIRKRYGRGWDGPGTCCLCHVRPVWAESAKARRMGLCKGCYLAEERRRAEEERESAALRQYRKRTRDGRKDGGN